MQIVCPIWLWGEIPALDQWLNGCRHSLACHRANYCEAPLVSDRLFGPGRNPRRAHSQKPERNVGSSVGTQKFKSPQVSVLSLQFRIVVAPRVGFEPTAIRLTVECSTAELSGSSPALAGQAAPIAARFFGWQGQNCEFFQAMNCSAAIRSSNVCSGSKRRVSGVPRSICTSTSATSRTSR